MVREILDSQSTQKKKNSNGARDTRFTIDKKIILMVREILD